MDDTLRIKILDRLKTHFDFKKANNDARVWREGRCPDCRGREVYVYTEKPWVAKCGRENKCGHEFSARDLFEDLFDNWSDRYPQTAQDPHAAAKAYLRDERGLNTVKLAGHFTQENYTDRKLDATSATVRFPMPGGGYWERLIDRVYRFGKRKASFQVGYKVGGHAWHHPGLTFEKLATASEIWFAEGIFDAVALGEAFETERPTAFAAASMSTNNYPARWLDQLADAVAATGTHAVRPTLVFAYDVGPAGVRETRKAIALARKAGWQARAAQVRPDGEGNKLDWNDLYKRRRSEEEGGAHYLSAADLETYLENGDITIAPTAAEKAFLLYRRSRRSEFPLIFKGRQLWARFSADRINQLIEGYNEDRTLAALSLEEKHDMAARDAAEVAEIANCTFRVLYYETDTSVGRNSYYIRVDFPGKQDTIKANFPGNVMLKDGPFADHLVSVAPGAIWDGSSRQLKHLMGRQIEDIRTVDALYFAGYSIEHGAWMFEDIAISGGRVIPLNDKDFFEIGKVGVKPNGEKGEFAIVYDPNEIAFPWWPDLWTAFGSLGLVTLAFWLLSCFAEQIRREYQSLGFLEVSGPPGSGKSTLLIFLWKLVGRRHNYEGFDPAAATGAGIARELVKYGNLPVVLLEGDRKKDQPSTRKFDWSELKKIYNGHAPRTRGVMNGGTSTFAPPFRGAMVIAQNDPIREAEEAVLERIMPLFVDKSRFTEEGKTAGTRLKRYEVEKVSSWIVAMIRQEKQILDYFRERFPFHEKRLMAHPEVQNDRLAYNHAQIAAALDCLAKAMSVDGKPVIRPEQAAAAHQLIEQMCLDQHGALGADHPHIVAFWETFDFLDAKLREGKLESDPAGIDLHRKPDVIAFRIPEVEQAFNAHRLNIPGGSMQELRKLLQTSKSRKYLGNMIVNCRDGQRRHCWVFQKPQQHKEALPV